MAEPIIVTVILNPVPDPSFDEPMYHAFVMLKEWAADHNVTVQPPIDTDAEALRYAALLVPDKEQVNTLIVELLELTFVDTCYKKPTDVPP
ncbi:MULTISPECIES: hypothetical protein [Psychrobacter]|uniref:Uncharacterized protein n=1 Tax=Psychrobacter saeujeotis TaxID=3143436 RepID=A0ABU9X8Z2_9GAMM|nr:hypothetical protein [uncultured Psychrobacter sp.]